VQLGSGLGEYEPPEVRLPHMAISERSAHRGCIALSLRAGHADWAGGRVPSDHRGRTVSLGLRRCEAAWRRCAVEDDLARA